MENGKKFPKIALGTWSWGVGAAGGDQVFGNHLGEADLKAVFDAAMLDAGAGFPGQERESKAGRRFQPQPGADQAGGRNPQQRGRPHFRRSEPLQPAVQFL